MWVITGGSSGLGATLARRARDRGVPTTVWDIREPQIDDVHYSSVDLREDSDVAAAVAALPATVSAFVHCAGLVQGVPLGSNEVAARLRTAFDVHVVGFAAATSMLLPRFAENASVVAVTSAASEIVYPGSLAYGASKAALSRVVRQLAVELGPRGVRVNAVAPGAMATEMTRDVWSDPETAERRTARIPLGRQGSTDEVAETIEFLASTQSSYITGHEVWVDGGVRWGTFNQDIREDPSR